MPFKPGSFAFLRQHVSISLILPKTKLECSMFVNTLAGMYVGAFPHDSYLSTQLLPINVKRAHALIEHRLCDFVVPVEPVFGYRGNAKPHFAVCFVQHLRLARRSSRPCRAFVCPLVSLVHNRSGMFNSLFHHVSRRTNSGTREDLAYIQFRIGSEIDDVMQFISASFSGPSCPVFA